MDMALHIAPGGVRNRRRGGRGVPAGLHEGGMGRAIRFRRPSLDQLVSAPEPTRRAARLGG
jgi:hypothetical protein